MYIMVYMNTKTATILNFKTDKKLKAEAKKVADELGLTLTTILNAMLKQFVRERAITLAIHPRKPSYEVLELLESKKN